MQGMQFAIIAKFLPCGSSASGETFQLPNNFTKSAPPPPPPPPPPPHFHSIPFRPSPELPQSRVPPPVPCVSALHRRRAPEQPTACATTSLPLRYCAPLSLPASLHSTEPCSEPELPLPHPTIRPCCALSPDPALPPTDASIPVNTPELPS